MKTKCLPAILATGFLFFTVCHCVFSQSIDTTRHFAKLGDSTTLVFSGNLPANNTYTWITPNNGTIDTGSDSTFAIEPVDTLDAGIYEILSAPASNPNDLVTVGFIALEPLCGTYDGEGDGCYICREIIVHFKDTSSSVKDQVMNSLAMDSLFAIKSCRCDSLILFRRSSFNLSGIDIESIADNAEDMVGIENVDFELNFIIQTGPIPDTTNVEGDTINIVVDTFPSIDCLEPIELNVAVIDAGIQRDHFHYIGSAFRFWENTLEADDDSDNDGNCYIDDYIGYDFLNQEGDDFQQIDGHGTHIAGIIFESPPNDDPDLINVMDLKFYEPDTATLFDAVCAMYYAIDQDAKVMNLSWGYYNDTISTVLTSALDAAQAADIVVIASAGNEKQNNESHPHWPSNATKDFDNMLSVAAVSKISPVDYTFAHEYSNFGPPTVVDLAAPGTKIRSTYPEHDLVFKSGTSMAAAYVSRVAAHARSCRMDVSATDIVSCLLSNLIPPTPPNEDLINGIINISAALSCVLTNTNEPVPTDGTLIYPLPFVDRFTIDLSAFPVQTGSFSLFHSSGQLVGTQKVTAGFPQELVYHNLPPGIYFYLLQLEEGLFSGKLIRR